MKKITLLAAVLAVLGAFEANAQTYVAISPTAEGGFELGVAFADNGWSVANGTSSAKIWQIGTGQPGYTGERCAFIGNSSTTVGTTNGNRRVHLYRSITVPADATDINLTFKYKQAALNLTDGIPADYLAVSLMDAIPVSGSTPSGIFMDYIPTAAPLADFTEMTGTLPATVAGTTKYLVFTFKATNNAAVPAQAFGAIDDIELTYNSPTMSVNNFNANKITAYPNPVKNMLHLSSVENIDSVSVFNLFGQNLLSKQINDTEAVIDMAAFATGNYIVNVLSDNNIRTIKVVK